MADYEGSALEQRTYPDRLNEQLEALQNDDAVRRFRESRTQLAADPYRPLYHFSPPEGVMNDPNGLCVWQKRYHLFYQFTPAGADRVHWGHTVSDDLVHWRDLPIALYPDQEKDCYSGQTAVERDRVIAIYHGTRSGNSIATASDPLLLNWAKHPGNPVIPIVPVDENGAPYRVFDPCIWKEDDGYYALSGTFKDGTRGVDCRNVGHLFRSRDLAEWEFLGPLIEDGFYTEPGEDGAVPNFWPIGNGKHMLLFFSHKRAAQYYVGTYDRRTHRLIPEYHGRMNYGPLVVGSLHAPSATVDGKGRFLSIFNVKDGMPQQGWSNLMTLPRHLSLDASNALRIEPVAEMSSLRSQHIGARPMPIPANAEVALRGVRGKAMEIDAIFDLGQARELGLCVFRSPDGQEQTRISLFRDAHRATGESALQIDVSTSSLRHDVFARTPEIGPLRIGRDEPLHLRVFLDRSIVEVYANGRQCLTLRAYPQRDDNSGVAVFARGGDARLVSFDAWQMHSIWPELREYEGK